MKHPLALAALILLSGCVGGTNAERSPEPFATRPATEVLRDGLILAAVKAPPKIRTPRRRSALRYRTVW